MRADQPEGPGDRFGHPEPSLSPQPSPRWDPFHYERRASRVARIGPVEVGGGNVVAVVARAGADGAARVLRWASPGNRRLPRPEIVEWPVEGAAALEALRDLRHRLDEARARPILTATGGDLPKLALLASGSESARLAEALPFVEGVLLHDPDPEAAAQLARATRAAGKALGLEARVADGAAESSEGGAIEAAVERLLVAAARAREAGQDDLVLTIGASTAEGLIDAQRLLITRLAELGDDTPIFLRSTAGEEPLIPTVLPLGSLLCDGFGDAIQAPTLTGGQDEAVLTLNVLQAAGTRLSKTDYVACPSCGRTLFDLQSTTERIKAKTAHLAGVKIAIMGCVVNGPGEMADADFGYVGGAPGQVNLYFGKVCVERNVPAEIADEKLIALIKSKGRWQEPEPEGEAGGLRG